MRFTYSVTTGSVMKRVLFSISEAYPLPILISVSVEYQLPIPRPPISRLPTALTSSMLPGLTLIFWLPGSTTFSGLTLAAATSPETGVVPGAGHGVVEAVSEAGLFLFFLFFFLSLLVSLAEGVQLAVGAASLAGGCAGAVEAG